MEHLRRMEPERSGRPADDQCKCLELVKYGATMHTCAATPSPSYPADFVVPKQRRTQPNGKVTMVKLITIFKRKPGISRDEFIRHWQQVHARIAVEDREFWSRVRKYVQNYVTSAGQQPAWDGVVELWFDSPAELDAAFSGEETKKRLIADLDNFVDQASMISVVTEENILYNGGTSLQI